MASAVGQNTLGIDANNFFTRGAAGQTENVGKSMVQLHAEQMQQEKEQNALQKLAVLLPQLGFFSRVVALRETAWDVDKALTLLRRFIAENDLKLKAIHKVRWSNVHRAHCTRRWRGVRGMCRRPGPAQVDLLKQIHALRACIIWHTCIPCLNNVRTA